MLAQDNKKGLIHLQQKVDYGADSIRINADLLVSEKDSGIQRHRNRSAKRCPEFHIVKVVFVSARLNIATSSL
jgi:hypothetical protein